MTGKNAVDFSAANKVEGLPHTLPGYTWHHHHDGRTMVLVPKVINLSMGYGVNQKDIPQIQLIGVLLQAP